jgi:predicted TIM-barrel fold metal-dependent hydrolase
VPLYFWRPTARSKRKTIVTQPIIDAHHHIWRLEKTPWLCGPQVPRIFGPYAPLCRDYSIADFLGEAQPCGVVKSVYVQVNVAPGEEVDEVCWVQSVARKSAFPHAITAFADLAAEDVADILDRELASGNVRAIRQQLHWHENSAYCFASRPDIMNDQAWRRGLREVHNRDLMFELQVFPGQMLVAEQLVRDFSDLTFILLHAGMLEDRSESGWARWRAGMKRLASCANLHVKLSGLGTFEHACSMPLWQPVIEQTMDMFGPGRCLFGSNFPIESLWTSYADLVGVMRACLARYSDADRRAVFHDNAARLYQI